MYDLCLSLLNLKGKYWDVNLKVRRKCIGTLGLREDTRLEIRANMSVL